MENKASGEIKPWEHTNVTFQLEDGSQKTFYIPEEYRIFEPMQSLVLMLFDEIEDLRTKINDFECEVE